MRNIYLNITDKYNSFGGLVFATVTMTAGSTPQKPGSSALLGESGLLAGTVGGGVVEGNIMRISREALKSGRSGHYHFNLGNDISDKSAAICGGRISVLVDADMEKNREAFEIAGKSLASRLPGVMITIVRGRDDNDVKIERYWYDRNNIPVPGEAMSADVTKAAEGMLDDVNHSGFREIAPDPAFYGENTRIFLEYIFPAPRLVIAGAGHIGRALSHLGNMTGFEVTVIDDRSDLACSDNLPDAHNIIVGNIGREMERIKKDSDTYVVIVTRGHNDDAEALKPCIGSGMAYTGMIGSRKKVKAMRDDFISNGWATPGQWDSVYTPVGLEIGSQTVEEIAVSIAAQLIQVKNLVKKEAS